ncbi:carboxypeptidase-like regulatory domain-containing protein [Kordia sp. YSTF-M3]|uniref:Carboxypeptidase-like regulatory domain-containing protein n=1 Tax=Kordia aestuariivivens TaxID=2759037 RepID=A0ABR7QGV1_9FLAO|nr:carboxypeptidase-like regulatory domain-containing protein [Kordia aestuariivivens]MBC8757549.1 carboxypeptidase-like regulatory domain-containing protein [Kordia aestuariivivens]
MKKIIYIISFLLTTTVFAQYTITIDAHVLDMDTKQPIPYVNIQCVGKDIKAITDASGKFTLTFDEDLVTDNDRFQFLTLDYDTITVEMPKLSKYLTVTNKIFLTATTNNKNENTLNGTVFRGDNTSIQNAKVRIKNTFTEVQTNVDGTFKIPAKIGDTLIVDYIGMYDKEIIVSNLTPLTVKLKPNAELLNTVLIKGKKAKKKKRYVDTGFGKADFDGFSLGSMLTSDDIGSHHVYLTDVLRGRIAGLNVAMGEGNIRNRFNAFARRSFRSAMNTTQTQPGQPVLSVRGTPALVFYDGFPYYGNINDIEIRTVDNIVVLKAMSATVLYGGQPTILITSKNRFLKRDESGNVIDAALLTNNKYDESVPLVSSTVQKPSYITELQQASNYAAALEIYNSQVRNSKLQTVSYYMDVSEYFMKWNSEKAIAILANIEKIAGNNPKALKAVAYKLEELEQYEKAKLIYQRIATLLPNSAQSYRDLALIYKHAGDYQESIDLYKKMLTNSIENIDFTGLEQLLLNELQQLLRRHRSEVDYKDFPSNLLTTTFKYDLRIVFEWNDADAEFELQFVNPENKFYTWGHSIIANKEYLLNEVKNGYHTEEFVIDEATDIGEWMINIKNLKEEATRNPTYLKYTIYKNYGTANEEKKVKVVKLYKQQQKATLDKIAYQREQ